VGKKVFIIDCAMCNGCYSCHIGCKDEHVGNDWTPIAKPQPEIGHFWLKMHEKIRGTVPKVKVAYRPHICMHCDNAPCMDACPIEGAIYKRDDGLVIIDPIKCTGCRNCVFACPYEAIYFNEELHIAQKCTGCAHLLDEGWKETRCSDNCPTLCLRLMEEDDPEAIELMAKAQVLKPELNTKPRVYYLNLPKKFIAGTIYDPVEDEVIIGGVCTLTGEDGETYTVTTNNYGDFWFEGLPDGKFRLEINANGKTLTFDDINTTVADINLGDIPVT
jgi:tetrathionate reductase subunit B